ncbi:MAG: hypothetical protein M3498_08095 [Deinococcota bacterium]|jgi:hypothetical protein|nr:hypothetical protein [Deinococcota bacterium]
MKNRILALAALLILAIPTAYAHQTATVGEGDNQFKVIVGMVREPIFTEERNGLDLIIRRADNDEPVENLEGSLSAEITSPDGQSTHSFTLRPQYGKPGYYTDEIMLSEPGDYSIRIFGFIGEVEFDETFETHGVRALSELRFP